jgi:hypothetical protein
LEEGGGSSEEEVEGGEDHAWVNESEFRQGAVEESGADFRGIENTLVEEEVELCVCG